MASARPDPADRDVAFGPVDDPDGGRGVGIVQATDRAEAEAMRTADPAVISLVAFREVIRPTPRLVTPGGDLAATPVGPDPSAPGGP